MTWAKYGSEFWRRLAFAGYSDAAARTHAEAIAYLYEVEPEHGDLALRIPKHLVRTFAGSPNYEAGVAECVKRGAWIEVGDFYELVDQADVVRASLTAQWAKKRRDVASQQRKRDRDRVSTDVSADAATDVDHDDGDDVSAGTDRQTDKQPVRERAGVNDSMPVEWHPRLVKGYDR